MKKNNTHINFNVADRDMIVYQLIDLSAPHNKLGKNKSLDNYYKSLCLELAHVIAHCDAVPNKQEWVPKGE